ncbi:MAG: type II toxin-antitoxin system prevent-host-death family antitoxin [Pyrinomonadaceae bacterium]|nr:type II toxin-antitoxin system prevent-host-death family antitoxin [Pyrinomonadaceae bacterium]
MPTQTINIENIEQQLADLLTIESKNGEIVIAQNGEPIARLESVKTKSKKRVAGLNKGAILTREDFDAPLTIEEMDVLFQPFIFSK